NPSDLEASGGEQVLAERAGDRVEPVCGGGKAGGHAHVLGQAADLERLFAVGDGGRHLDREAVIGGLRGFRERASEEGVKFGHGAASNMRRSFSVPLKTWDFTVPRGRPVIS